MQAFKVSCTYYFTAALPSNMSPLLFSTAPIIHLYSLKFVFSIAVINSTGTKAICTGAGVRYTAQFSNSTSIIFSYSTIVLFNTGEKRKCTALMFNGTYAISICTALASNYTGATTDHSGAKLNCTYPKGICTARNTSYSGGNLALIARIYHIYATTAASRYALQAKTGVHSVWVPSSSFFHFKNKKQMPQQTFIPQQEGKRIDWLVNFASKLPNYAAKYKLATEDVKDVQDGAAFVSDWYDYKIAIGKHVLQVTQYNSEEMNGVATGAVASQMPVAPALPTLPALAPGIFARAVAMAKGIKTQTVFTDADGKDLGLFGTDSTVDVHNMKPNISVRIISGGYPEIVWNKQKMDGVEIYKDSGDGTFILLAYDSYPNYTDTTPLPAAAQSATWKYKAIYKYRDEVAGQWSDVVSITVAGN